MILIIMGVILGIFALAGFGAVMGGLAPDPITSLNSLFDFFINGNRSDTLGIQRRKNKHIKVNQSIGICIQQAKKRIACIKP